MTGRALDVALLARLEQFYDAVPRPGARTEDLGPFTLFISLGDWSFYARPRLGLVGEIDPADVAAMRTRQRELHVPETFEWVVETTPSLAPALRADGLVVEEVPLLVLREHHAAPVPAGYRLRRIAADEPNLELVLAVAAVAFANGGTATGDAGSEARDRRAATDTRDHTRLRQRLAERAAVMYVIEGHEGPVASGAHQAVDGVTELVGVATLPVVRRRGLGAAVTSALIDDALEAGIGTIFLSAASEDVAKIYERLGFDRIGHAGLAEPTSQIATGGETG
jgi:N-acetylglutamate synthase-like GNAT family acetyltransferase